jgi:hypothetical protein
MGVPTCLTMRPVLLLRFTDARMGISMASTEKTLDDLFLDTLKDIYYAEKQILKALPKMA